MRKIFDVNKTRRCTAYLNSIIILKYINHTNWAVTYTYILLKLILYVFNWQFSYNPKLNYSVWVIINIVTSRFWQDLNDFECIWGIIRISVFIFQDFFNIFWSPIKCFLSHLNPGNINIMLKSCKVLNEKEKKRSCKVTILILSISTSCCCVGAVV